MRIFMIDNNNETLFAEERKAKIVELINEKGKVLVPDLIDHFKMSPATIRNDLRDLETAGLIKRTHGGAMPNDFVKAGFELDNMRKTIKHLSAKEAIALKAAEMIDDGDIIILDTGTTTFELAKLLKDKNNLTVIVNDIKIAASLESFEGINVVLLGGSLRKNFHCTIGPFAVKMLSELNVDKVFLGTNGFSMQKGCTTPDINQAEIKKVMIDVAIQVIVLCDSSKVGKNSFVQFIRPEEVDVMITDEHIHPAILKEITDSGIDTYAVKYN